MAGSSGLAIAGKQDVRRSWELSMILLLIQTVTGNQGSIVGSCPCDSKLPDSPNSEQLQFLAANLQGYHRCRSYIRFRLPKRTLCANSKNDWVQKLRTCFDNQECGFSRVYQSRNQAKDDYLSTKIQSSTSTGLDHSLLFTTTNPVSQADLQPTEIWYVNDTTSAPPKNTSMANLKQEAEKQPIEKQGISTITPILGLLGIVFVLAGALAYFLCRRKASASPKQRPKGSELVIPCETNLL